MREIKQNDRIELLLPATRELMLVVRLATSGVVARAGLTIDVLDDVKMAVEEACMYMMTQVPESARLKLEFGLGEKKIEVKVACETSISCSQSVSFTGRASGTTQSIDPTPGVSIDCGPCSELGSSEGTTTMGEAEAELEVVRCILESLVDQVEICREGSDVRGICLKAGTGR